MKFWMLLIFISPMLLVGEIEEVRIKWKAADCDTKCHKLLEREFKGLSKASNVEFNASSGEVVLKWRPNEVFRPEVLDRIGLRRSIQFEEVQVTIRGVVKKKGQNSYSISSLGDETRFFLAPKPNKKEAEETKKPQEKKPKKKAIPPNFIKRLEELARSEKVVSMQGIIEMPYKQPNVLLIPE